MESEFITRLLEPEPRLAEGRALSQSRAVTAMMDNSDGLALSLSDLAQVSHVGFVVQEEALPLADGLVETSSWFSPCGRMGWMRPGGPAN